MESILIIDDEKDNLDALTRLLRNQYEVVTTVSPFEGLKQIQRREFSVIISDQRMPEMTGVELLEKAKTVAEDSVRMLLTGYTEIDSIIQAINRGQIYRYIAKPWDPEDFKLAIKQAAEAYQMRKLLKQKNAELSKALQELQGLDRAKQSFMALVSHELRTPITVLQSFIQFLNTEKKKMPSDLHSPFTRLEEASGRLGEIVQEVLSYLNLELEGNWKKEKLSLRAILDKALKTVFPKNDHPVEWKEESDLEVLADPIQTLKAIEKVFSEIASRLKPKGKIQIKLEKSGKVKIYFEGERIQEEALKLFSTGRPALHHQTNMGLALATAKLIFDKQKIPLSLIQQGQTLELDFS